MTQIATLALDELTRRRDNAARGVATCRMTVEQANLRTALWGALALYAGAALPADLHAQLRGPHDPDPVHWWEFAPRGTDPAIYLRAARKELQRATIAAIITHERDKSAATLTRARNLIALYTALAKDALGPLPLTLRTDQVASGSAEVGEVKQAA